MRRRIRRFLRFWGMENEAIALRHFYERLLKDNAMENRVREVVDAIKGGEWGEEVEDKLGSMKIIVSDNFVLRVFKELRGKGEKDQFTTHRLLFRVELCNRYNEGFVVLYISFEGGCSGDIAVAKELAFSLAGFAASSYADVDEVFFGFKTQSQVPSSKKADSKLRISSAISNSKPLYTAGESFLRFSTAAQKTKSNGGTIVVDGALPDKRGPHRKPPQKKSAPKPRLLPIIEISPETNEVLEKEKPVIDKEKPKEESSKKKGPAPSSTPTVRSKFSNASKKYTSSVNQLRYAFVNGANKGIGFGFACNWLLSLFLWW
ncbi:hypothetical protein BUALT_Bualt12G0002400 [Buddleja alternifolia]|uniref:Uncharacterized protein n=1 Tax=Buddleja alternifolia TaxID=168488 RepID=A0AAV6WXW5_9LAMI|nr:hypothetical protein BUALT_Bualt12G0002400 [Buddleja alternifolia]